jgi:predicted amidohydrolase YtcJ
MARTLTIAVVTALLMAAGVPSIVRAQQAPPDVILTNGKIITVDERFTIAQAVAIKGDRFVAVGTNQDITRLAGPATRRIDLKGRSVTPGLIDNHMHVVRAAGTWRYEVRLDGVESRQHALDMLRARAAVTPSGEWIYTLGGWAIEQFAGDKRPFTSEELDQAVPNNPVFLQASYREAFLNSRAIQLLGVNDAAPTPAIIRDGAGKPTGRVLEAGFRQLAAKLPTASGPELEASTRLMMKDVNRMGLTAFGSAGCEADILPTFRKLADQGQLNVRIGCIVSPAGGGNVDQLLPRIAQMKLFQGDSYIDQIFYGESVFGPLHDPMFIPKSDPKPDQLATWRRIATEIAKAHLPLHVHANLTNTLDAFLDQIEQINKEYPIRNLRWTLAHVNQLNASHLERMKQLGMYAAVHPWAVINGGINQEVFGDAAYDMAQLSTIQNSGIMGFGSDGRAEPDPAVTSCGGPSPKDGGRHPGPSRINTISQDALIAHAPERSSCSKEDNLGPIQPGKLADRAVLDRDYRRFRPIRIKHQVRQTMVGGRVVYDASTEPVALAASNRAK